MGTKRGSVKDRTKAKRPHSGLLISGLRERLAALRLSQSQVPGNRLSLQDLARLVDRPFSTVKQWYYEEKISTADAVRLAVWSNRSLDWLLGRADNRAGAGPGGPQDERSVTGTADAPTREYPKQGPAVAMDATAKLLRELAFHDDLKLSVHGRRWFARRLLDLAKEYDHAGLKKASEEVTDLAVEILSEGPR